MFRCCCLLGSLLLLGDVTGDASRSRIRRQSPDAQSGQLIDNIFNIPITAIKQTAAAAQVFSPENTQAIDTVFKIPVSTLEAVGALVKTTRDQRQQNAEDIQRNRQERRDRLSALREQRRKQKEELHNRRLLQQQSNRVVRHQKDPFGLNAWSNAWSDVLGFGHHGLLGHHVGGHHPGLGGGIHGLHGSHGIHGGHGGLSGNRPHHGYEVHEEVNEDTSFSWHGLTAGFGTFYGTRPSNNVIKIENKIAPKEKKQKDFKFASDDVNPQNKIARIKNKPAREDDPPIENKIAPRNGKVTFV